MGLYVSDKISRKASELYGVKEKDVTKEQYDRVKVMLFIAGYEKNIVGRGK